MADVVIDTHSAVWYLADLSRLSKPAETAIDNAVATGKVFVSSITIVELIYLTEKGRVAIDVLDKLCDSLDDVATSFTLVEISRAIADEVASIPRSTVPDMPDRIIAATALYLNLSLITKDNKIRSLPSVRTIW